MTSNYYNRSLRALHGGGLALAAVLALSMSATSGAQVVSQTPLSVGGNVPGNLVLTPSVEFPTLNSKANLGAYSSGTTYVGYFDPHKCYVYVYNATESLRHFAPNRQLAAPAVCSAASKEWSGNWLNWATTQTIDPFRKALTGGLRVRDTAGETWLEKARHDGQGGAGYFPNATTTGAGTLAGALPTSWSTIYTRVWGGGSELYFTSTCPGPTNLAAGLNAAVDYDPATHNLNATNTFGNVYCPSSNSDVRNTNANRIYRVSVRVKVCDSGVGLESNCVAYGGNYKPEGLIQKYSGKMRFSIFGYLLDNGAYRDGGVMRARQKYVGPLKLDKATREWVANPLREWNDNGTFVRNPDSADAAATTTAVGDAVNYPIQDSGVINYLNKFGQMTGTNAKNFDPVSEMYYTALRYVRKLPPVPIYSDLTRSYGSAAGSAVAAGVGRYNLADGFPVITDWYPDSNPDAYEYWCQSSAVLGIGDVYTHKDKNLKGNTASTSNEPSMPALVSSDPIIDDVVEWTRRAYALEGVTMNIPLNGGLHNSPYMVGLAYHARTQDLRTETELPEKQTISTHWVDVRERQVIEPRIRNQYWMAAKYGGFSVPDDFNSRTHATALPNAWWSTDGDTLTSNSGDWANETFRRASNYYVADRPQTMVESLTRAFAKIASEKAGSGSSLAANSTRLDTDTRTFQAQFLSGSWLGQLTSFSFNTATGTLSSTPVWSAGEQMPAWNLRNIWVHDPQNTGGSKYKTFRFTNLGSTQQTKLTSLAALSPATGTQVVNYIRGDQSLEESVNGTLRTRSKEGADPSWSPILGDIVNSTPIYVGAPNAALYANTPGTWNGKSSYASYAAAQAGRAPLVWVGANDGMVHAFNAETGAEVYAFVPNASIDKGLVNVADPDYQHQYFVDGDLAIADIYDGTNWRTILVGSMGRGGPGIFALDITTPPTTASPNTVQFLWEVDESDIPSLGRNIGRPIITQIANGEWRVLLGNGPDSTGGTAKLIMLDVLTGDADVIDTDTETDNGLSAVLARDTNADGISDTAYAGDLAGRLWKFTSLGGTPAVSTLFTATDPGGTAQPITAAPAVARDPATGIPWVFFGTGRYLGDTDPADTQRQSWYGFQDTGVAVTRAELKQRTAWNVGPVGNFLGRLVDEASADDMAGFRGWYMDLPETGERMVVPNQFQGGALISTTRTPDSTDVCRPSGGGWIMAINPFTGARLQDDFFDMNEDTEFNDEDRHDDSDSAWDDGDEQDENVSGLGERVSMNRPIFIENKMCYTMDDGTTRCVTIQGSSVQARRGSWREIMNN